VLWSLDVLLVHSDNKGLVADIKVEMAAAVDALRKKRGKGGGTERTAAKEAGFTVLSPRLNCEKQFISDLFYSAGVEDSAKRAEAAGKTGCG
jgi:hypothetical protein